MQQEMIKLKMSINCFKRREIEKNNICYFILFRHLISLGTIFLPKKKKKQKRERLRTITKREVNW